jgi:penicillin-binding protein 1A
MDKEVLGRIYLKNRTNVPLDEISEYVVKALIPTEDVRFFKHQGVDKRSLMRVFFKSLLLGDRSSGGGSTLSQQLAKNIYPRGNYGPFSMPAAKLREAIIATRLERIYNKEEVLNLYLNTVPFGEDTYGIEEGAKRFFSKHAADLKLDEAAILVGMLKAPTRYNPRLFPERSLHRRNVVLMQMAKYQLITEELAKKTALLPIKLSYKRVSTSDGAAPYLRERIRLEVRDYLKNHVGPNGEKYNLYTDGLKIYTTIDSRLQRYAEAAMTKHMTYLQKTFDRHWAKRSIWGRNQKPLIRAVKRSERYRKLKARGLSHEQIMANFKKKVNTEIFTWQGMKERKITPLDSVKHTLKLLSTGVMSMDPGNGRILTYIGGINHHEFKYDHVTSKRQTGSIFKPFVYLAAMRNGVSPFEYYKNERKTYPEYNNWSPANAENHYTGYYSMEGALAESVNTVAVDMLFRAGLQNTIDLVHQMGIDSDLPEYPSLALGVANISLWDMVQAYACIANGGFRVEPHYLLRIEDNQGRVIADFESDYRERERVLTSEEAGIMNHMLQAVVNDGTARSLRRVYGLKNEMGGKTGTTNNHADGWFVGYSPSMVTGIWTGGEDMSVHFRSLTLGQGGHMALPIFARYMQKVTRDSRFDRITYDHFPLLSWGIRSDLRLAHYTETLPSKRNMFDKLFGKKSEKEEQLAKTRKKEVPKKKRSKIYRFIKSIFGKKK